MRRVRKVPETPKGCSLCDHAGPVFGCQDPHTVTSAGIRGRMVLKSFCRVLGIICSKWNSLDWRAVITPEPQSRPLIDSPPSRPRLQYGLSSGFRSIAAWIRATRRRLASFRGSLQVRDLPCRHEGGAPIGSPDKDTSASMTRTLRFRNALPRVRSMCLLEESASRHTEWPVWSLTDRSGPIER